MSEVYLVKNKDQYSILSDFGDDLGDLREKGHAIDELIAEPIMKLCNKGYITNYSCSGHAYPNMSYKILEDADGIEKVKKEDCFAIVPFLDTEAICICYIDDKLEDETYISFEEKQIFESVPDGWVYEKNALRYKWDIKSCPTDFYISLLKQIKKLIEWIDILPNKNM